MRRRRFLVSAACAAGFPAAAQQEIANARALSGDRFLAGDQEFQLADVIAPSLYTLTQKPSAYFNASRERLSGLLATGVVIKDVGELSRWGVQPVHAFMGDGRSLQEILCSEGAVRVSPRTENYEFIDRLLTLERKAREAGKGLWSLPDYRVYDAASAEGAIGAFQLVEGVVARAAVTRSRFYLNFGADYRTDFTAGAVSRTYRRWAKDGLDLAVLEGERVRIRGFVEEINGPSVDLLHPKQIER